MFSNDSSQLNRFLLFSNNFIIAPFQILITLILIWKEVGIATLVGLAFLIVMVPFNGLIFRLMNQYREIKVKETDVRVKLMNEILSGIRIIKYYAWERAFQKKILDIRTRELIILKKAAYTVAFGLTLILMASPIIQPVLIFYTYIRLGNQLDASTAFTTIALFNLLMMPFAFLPFGLAQYAQTRVSVKRLLDFLDAPELQPYVQPTVRQSAGSEERVSIRMDNATLTWLPIDDDHTALLDTAEGVKGEVLKGLDQLPSENTLKQQRSSGEAMSSVVEPALRHSLRQLSLEIPVGKLVAVVGGVGSGKSSLLSSLLGELNLVSGSVQLSGLIAYCDQRPWILNATVKDNILFGMEYDEERFDAALFAASLEEDMRSLEAGVLTEIGERGINLSGGQKARISLARAVYRNADVYLLDDPLSAVDAHVGKHIFHHCIRDTLSSKTRLLVTHQVQYLPEVDYIVLLEDGAIRAQGTYDDLAKQGIDLTGLMAAAEDEPQAAVEEEGPSRQTEVMHLVHASPAVPEGDRPRPNARAGTAMQQPMEQGGSPVDDTQGYTQEPSTDMFLSQQPRDELETESQHYSALTDLSENGGLGQVVIATAALRKKEKRRESTLMSLEERQTGSVSWAAYSSYIGAGGHGYFWFAVLLITLSQGCLLLASFYLAYWGKVSVRREEQLNPLSGAQNVHFLSIYAAISGMAILLVLFRSIIMAEHRIGTSAQLHGRLLTAVIGAPVAFFDVTPLGRILNRFSSDIVTLDEELSQTLFQVSNAAFSVLGAIAGIAAATKGSFLAIMAPMTVTYYFIQNLFRATNTAVARLQSISLSPIYADFSQALVGVSSIRAYNKQTEFIAHLEALVDRNTIAVITQALASQWLAIRLDCLGAVTTFFIAAVAVAFPNFIPAGFLGLGLSYAFQITSSLKFDVRMLAQFEAQMNSIERINYYIEHVEQEEPKAVTEAYCTPSPEWPEHGHIIGLDVQLRYRDGPLVLRGLDFAVEAGEKVGIAGRTGSGKSSLMVALFRIQRLAAGQILIDGVDISTVPLHVLRSKIAIIPQDPVMFSASVRFNLDPFDQHEDAVLWSTLESVGMKEYVQSLPGRLLESVAEGGDNFSAGQRQLICIGRALLRSPKILVLDEATASVDNETDEVLQKMLRVSFKHCTVLTIAHRLNTIVDSDKLLILDNGLLMESDTPANLLARPQGQFRSLWDKHQKSHNHGAPSASTPLS